MPAKIEFANVADLSRLDRFVMAGELREAVKSNDQLATELPLPNKGYSSRYRKAARLKSAARKAETANLNAFVITANSKAIGMATAQVALPKPALIEEAPGGIELSYWHRQEPTREALRIGRRVMMILVGQASLETYGAEPDFVRWMVTLPEDEIKSKVCEEIGMQPVGEPQPFEIGDEVTIDRQLWALQPDQA